jgi:iron complex outermembrane recepter protein
VLESVSYMAVSRKFAPVIAALMVAPVAYSQTPPDSVRGRLDTVTVTAAREPRSLAETPFAVSVVNQQQWEGRSGFGLDHALQQVPGVIAQSRFGSHDVRLVIRGYGARGAGDRSNAGTSRGIRVLLDGIPETEPDGRTAFDLVDLATIERMEVMRSNGSAVWGNAGGGIVSLSSRPDFTSSFYDVGQQAGSFGLFRTIARAGVGRGGARGWLSLTRTSFDGWREHSDASRTQVIGGGDAMTPGGGRLGVQVAAASNLFRIPGPLTPEQFAADPRQANATYLFRDERRYNRLMRVGFTLDQPLGSASDVSLMVFAGPKYLQRSERNTFRDFTRYHVGGSSAYGHRFSVGGTPHRLRIGGDFAYQDGSIQFYNLGPGNTRGTTLTTNKGEAAQNAGIFLQDEVQAGEKISLLLGVRYDDLSYFYRDFISPATNASRRFSRLSPRGGITYRPREGTTIYASYGAGVEIPAGNETDSPPVGTPGGATALNPLLDPILSGTIETGMRTFGSFSAALVKYLSLDLAAYTTRVEGEPVPYNSGRFYLTAGKVTRSGLELGVVTGLAAGFTSRLSGTISRNRYDDYRIDSTYLGRPGASAVYDGNAVAGIPGRVLNASLTWRPPTLDGVALELGSQSFGDYFADDRNAVKVPGFTVLRASARVSRMISPVTQMSLALSVDNLVDRRYVASAFINPDYVGGRPAVYEAGLPRSFLVSVSFRRLD